MKKLFVLALLIVATATAFSQTDGQYQYRPECNWYGREATQCSQDWYLYVYYPLLCHELCEGDICLGLFPSTGGSYRFDQPLCCEFEITGEAGWFYDAFVTSTDFLGGTMYFDWSWGNSLALAINPVESFNDNDLTSTYQFQLPAGPPDLATQYHRICATGVDIDAGAHGFYSVTTTLTAIYSL